MQFSVETWAPEYGIAADGEQLDDASAEADATVERRLDDWAPITPGPSERPDRILFVDGIQRIDARVWVHENGISTAAVCASVAAGVVACTPGHAEVCSVEVFRGLYAPASSTAGPVVTRHATYQYVPTKNAEPEALYFALHEQRTNLELRAADGHDADVVVFDGPLRGRNDANGVGYVKTHHRLYVPDDVRPVLGQLDAGQRTPLICLAAGRGGTRWTWYLRLPGPRSHPLSGIVRCELPGTGTLADAIARAESVSACLPRFASQPHKEPRAPQNLYPIAGLEHRLRRHLGDPLLLERSLRVAAAHAGRE